ncbi:NAD(P)-dependent oxidoreductase [Streptomyces flaveolus]|uniref:NAD(P)-dependent oxidoreductase n=1 Tax=Streptomyces flaveolus TaxID=67297 RepID=UPI0033FADB47
MDIGFAGAGRMGRPMVKNLAARGHVVSVFDPWVDSTTAFGNERVRAVRSAAELAPLPLSISMLPDADTTADLLTGSGGLYAAARPGHCHIAMGTTGPRAARDLAAAAEKAGIDFADAPVSGSVSAAESGAITTMVGSSPEVFERVRPVLAAMTAAQFHVGPIGSGAAAKLAVNLVIGSLNQAVAEAILLGEAAGLEPAALYDVLERSAAGSPFVRAKRAAFLTPDTTPVAAPVSLLAKDLRLILALADECGHSLPGTSVVGDLLEQACAAGDGDLDMAQILRAVRRASHRA